MPVEAIYGMLAFGAMFVLWVVLPSIIRQRHQIRATADTSDDRNSD